MKNYNGYYRAKGNKNNMVFETSVTANNYKEAIKYLKSDLSVEYTLIKVKLN